MSLPLTCNASCKAAHYSGAALPQANVRCLEKMRPLRPRSQDCRRPVRLGDDDVAQPEGSWPVVEVRIVGAPTSDPQRQDDKLSAYPPNWLRLVRVRPPTRPKLR